MNTMRRLLLVAAAVSLLAARARAASPVTIETNWDWNVCSSSFTNVTSKTVDVGGSNCGGLAGLGISPDHKKNVVAFRYTIYAAGATATYTVSHATKTYSPSAITTAGFTSPAPVGLAGTVPVISTSPAVNVPAAVLWPMVFETQVTNPVFTFSSLSAAATYWLTVDVGVPVN